MVENLVKVITLKQQEFFNQNFNGGDSGPLAGFADDGSARGGQ